MYPKQATAFHWLHRVTLISTAYIKSGHLRPLTADGAETDFVHIILHTQARAGQRPSPHVFWN